MFDTPCASRLTRYTHTKSITRAVCGRDRSVDGGGAPSIIDSDSGDGSGGVRLGWAGAGVRIGCSADDSGGGAWGGGGGGDGGGGV